MTLSSNDNHDSPPPETLAARVREGDSKAFEQIFRAYYDLLLRYAYGLIKSNDLARDLVADVFAAVWHKHQTWEPKVSIRAYLLTAVRNRAFDWMRTDSRRTALQEHAAIEDLPGIYNADIDPLAKLDAEARINLVYAAIDAMRGLRREVMVLRWREQLSITEIASTLGISEASVNTHLSQALKILRTTIGVRS